MHWVICIFSNLQTEIAQKHAKKHGRLNFDAKLECKCAFNLCIIYGLNYIALFLSHVIQSCVSNWTNFLKIYIENKTEM